MFGIGNTSSFSCINTLRESAGGAKRWPGGKRAGCGGGGGGGGGDGGTPLGAFFYFSASPPPTSPIMSFNNPRRANGAPLRRTSGPRKSGARRSGVGKRRRRSWRRPELRSTRCRCDVEREGEGVWRGFAYAVSWWWWWWWWWWW